MQDRQSCRDEQNRGRPHKKTCPLKDMPRVDKDCERGKIDKFGGGLRQRDI